MDLVYWLQGVEFEWDEQKAQRNTEKHCVTFEEAAEVLSTLSINMGTPRQWMRTSSEISFSAIPSRNVCCIGQGLRHDVAQQFADRVLELPAQILTRHGQSQEQVDTILREIRSATGT